MADPLEPELLLAPRSALGLGLELGWLALGWALGLALGPLDLGLLAARLGRPLAILQSG